MNLIFDRTAADVQTAREQRGKTTTPLKGCYNASDMNRVAAAVTEIAAELNSAGYAVEIKPRVERVSRLPAGYTELTFIKSSGTQYIDSGFKPNQNSAVTIDLEIDGSFSEFTAPFGARVGNTLQFWTFTNKNGSHWSARYGTTNVDVSKPITGRHTVSLSKNVFSVDGASVTASAATFQSAHNIWIFAANNGGAIQYPCVATIYSCKIYNNGTLVRDFVPAKNSTGAAGLYDLKNGTFHPNAGSGSFEVGDEVYTEKQLDEYTESDIIKRSEFARYLSNVQAIRDAISVRESTPELPSAESKLNFGGANDIEKILADVAELLRWLEYDRKYCGTFRAGQNILPRKG